MNKFVCEDCGSDQIQEKAWVWVNSGKIAEGSDFGEREDHWCVNCESHTYFVLEETYLEHKRKDEDE